MCVSVLVSEEPKKQIIHLDMYCSYMYVSYYLSINQKRKLKKNVYYLLMEYILSVKMIGSISLK